MTRTQIQLPDELHRRAKQFARERELSLAEITRRGLEMLLDRYPSKRTPPEEWKLPCFDGGGILVPLDKLHDISYDEESTRSL